MLNDDTTLAGGRLARSAVVLALLALWIGAALVVGIGRTAFFAGAVAIGGGYLLLRFVHAVERLAAAAERIADRRD